MPPSVFLVIITHTTRHLAVTLASLRMQVKQPAGVILSVDGEDPEIISVAQSAWGAANIDNSRLPPFVVATRPHMGEARLNQARNNGLRALDKTFNPELSDLVMVLDGDILLSPDAVERYCRSEADVVIPYRLSLTESETKRFDGVSFLTGSPPDLNSFLTGARLNGLDRRHRRYERQLRDRRLPIVGRILTKPHKPKIIGCHHAVRVEAMREVNGYDEMYAGYGYDDDDLSLRLNARRSKIQVAVRDIKAFHLYHPSRAPARPRLSPNYERFTRRCAAIYAESGWGSPREQPPVTLHYL